MNAIQDIIFLRQLAGRQTYNTQVETHITMNLIGAGDQRNGRSVARLLATAKDQSIFYIP